MKCPDILLARWLLDRARQAITRSLGLEGDTRYGQSPPGGAAGGGVDQIAAQGLFVTLRTPNPAGEPRLRGCIGRFSLEGDLLGTLEAMAQAAAFEDPRFPALKPEELPVIEVEITLLGPRKGVAGPQDIVLGHHGICLECRGHFAVFLPQVAKEQGWNLEETMEALSRKAGLPPLAWRQDDCRFEVFEACHFAEGQPGSQGGPHG